MLKRILLGTGVVLVAGLAWGTYTMVWGKPFGGIGVLADRQGIEVLLQTPEFLSSVGLIDGTMLDFHSGRLADRSWERRAEDIARFERFAQQLDWYKDDTLEGQDRLTYEIMRWQGGIQREMMSFAWTPSAFGGLYPIDQIFGQNNMLPRFMEAQHPLKNRLTAENYVKRLEAFDEAFAQTLDIVRRQAAMGVVPPSFVIERVLGNVDAFLAPAPADHPLVTSFRNRLAAVGDMDDAAKAALVEQAARAVEDHVYPAWRAIGETMQALKPQASPEPGVWRLPDGERYYANRLRHHTTTDLSPAAVHQLGLDEVAKLSAQMHAILDAQGLPPAATLALRMKPLNEDPQYLFENTQEGRTAALARYTKLIRDVEPLMPTFFETIPPQPVEVQRIPEYSEQGAPGAYYQGPALDGSRPGRFFVNLRDMGEQPKWTMATLAYHEAIPGHHWQIAWAQNIEGIPYTRRMSGFTVYNEGWALYAEQLMDEAGVYANDPLGRLGYLQAQIFRAVRLVVDTGMHAKRWSREDAIRYMVDNTGMSESDVTAEIERYAVLPGQACAYTPGKLKIVELRERAKAALGAGFDLKRFHTAILGSGSMPLAILDTVVNDWIAAEQARLGQKTAALD